MKTSSVQRTQRIHSPLPECICASKHQQIRQWSAIMDFVHPPHTNLAEPEECCQNETLHIASVIPINRVRALSMTARSASPKTIRRKVEGCARDTPATTNAVNDNTRHSVRISGEDWYSIQRFIILNLDYRFTISDCRMMREFQWVFSYL